MWYELSKLIEKGISSLIASDFNYIVGSQEKMEGGRHHANNIKFRKFQEFIGMNRLVDLGFYGPGFMWCNRVWENINKAFAMPR